MEKPAFSHSCQGKPKGQRRKGQGPSSYWLQDPAAVFEILPLLPGDRVLDLGCGAGEYALEAARRVGPSGLVTAIDNWPPIIDALEQAALADHLSSLKAVVADIAAPPLPLEDNSVDLCMMFTTLHIFGLFPRSLAIFREAARVLSPKGRLAILECKKEEMPFGQPVHMRLAPNEIEAFLQEMEFTKTGYTEFEYTYLLSFSPT